MTFDSLGIRTVSRLRISQYQKDSEFIVTRVPYEYASDELFIR